MPEAGRRKGRCSCRMPRRKGSDGRHPRLPHVVYAGPAGHLPAQNPPEGADRTIQHSAPHQISIAVILVGRIDDILSEQFEIGLTLASLHRAAWCWRSVRAERGVLSR